MDEQIFIVLIPRNLGEYYLSFALKKNLFRERAFQTPRNSGASASLQKRRGTERVIEKT